MKKFKFYLEPYTFIWEKQNDILLYNSISSKVILIKKHPDIQNIISSFKNIDLLGGVEITEAELKNSLAVKDFVSKVRDSFSGDLIDSKQLNGDVVVLKPCLNFQKDPDKINEGERDFIGENVVQNLFEIDLYLTGECSHNCTFCSDQYKQLLFCKKDDKKLSINQISSFLPKTISSGLIRINIICGDLYSYDSLQELFILLDKYKILKIFHIHYLNALNLIEKYKYLTNDTLRLNILVNFPIDHLVFSTINQQLKNTSINPSWSFVISSKAEYEESENLVKKFNITEYDTKPFFNGSNESFFEDHIYMHEEDFQHLGLDRRQIFAHQEININHFGTLVINSDGKVYANILQEPLGTIDDDIKELLYAEMQTRSSWRRIRDMKPCSDCVYQWLCPSPSNYELAIGKPNLCHVKSSFNEGCKVTNEHPEPISGST